MTKIKITKATYELVKQFNLHEWHIKAEKNGEIVGTTSGKHVSGVVYIEDVQDFVVYYKFI